MQVRRVIGYVRVAPREPRSARPGLDEQRRVVEAECSRRGWQLIRFEQDVRSGRSLRRPGLLAALDACGQREADGIVVARLDRLTYSVEDLAYVIAAPSRTGSASWRRPRRRPRHRCRRASRARALGRGEVAVPKRRPAGRLALEHHREGRAAGVSSTPPALADRIRALRASGSTLQAICDTLNAEGVPDASRRHSLETDVAQIDPQATRRSRNRVPKRTGEPMKTALEYRVDALEQQVALLEGRLAGRDPHVPPPDVSTAPSPPTGDALPPPQPAPVLDLEPLPSPHPCRHTCRRHPLPRRGESSRTCSVAGCWASWAPCRWSSGSRSSSPWRSSTAGSTRRRASCLPRGSACSSRVESGCTSTRAGRRRRWPWSARRSPGSSSP